MCDKQEQSPNVRTNIRTKTV